MKLVDIIKINHGCKTAWTPKLIKSEFFCVLIKIYASLNEITQKFNHLFREGWTRLVGGWGAGTTLALAEIYLLALISLV